MIGLLRSGDETALASLVAAERRVIRFLVPRLWDEDRSVRERAARALGEAAIHHEELTRETVRKLMWGLNDESGTNGGPGLLALGEIGRRAPALIGPYVPALGAMVGDAGLRVAVLGALAAVAASAPELVAPSWPGVAKAVVNLDPAERAAADALREALEGRGV